MSGPGTEFSVKRNGITVRKNVANASLTPGEYQVYSTLRYRSKTPYTFVGHLQTIGVYVSLSTCTVTKVSETFTENLDPNWESKTFEADCEGSPNKILGAQSCTAVRTGQINANFSQDYAGYLLFASVTEGAVFEAGSDFVTTGLFDSDDWNCSYTSTAYRYGSVKTVLRVRTHTVVKVYNRPSMSLSEFRSIKTGDSLARVRQIVGSKGQRYYESSYGTGYKWATSAGGTAYVYFSFSTGASSKDWYET